MSEPNSPFYLDNPLWGIGTIIDKNGEGFNYGYPHKGLDPDLFEPDREVCSPQEIWNWELSKKFKIQCRKTKELLTENKKLRKALTKLKTKTDWQSIEEVDECITNALSETEVIRNYINESLGIKNEKL